MPSAVEAHCLNKMMNLIYLFKRTQFSMPTQFIMQAQFVMPSAVEAHCLNK